MLTRMPGPVALVGSGEFLPAMASFDADLLAVDRPVPPARGDPADGVLAGRQRSLPPLGDPGFGPLHVARRRGRAGAGPGPRRCRGCGPCPGDRRGRPDLPVGRQAGVPVGGPAWDRGGAGDLDGPRTGCGRHGLLGRGDDPGRAALGHGAPPAVLAAALARRARAVRGRVRHPALRRVPGGIRGPASCCRRRAEPRLSGSTRRRRSSAATARGRSTVARG